MNRGGVKVMGYLPNDIKMLKELLTKKREDFEKAKKRFDYFVEMQKSELYDKWVTGPLAEAKSLGKTKEELEIKRQEGLSKYNLEFEKDRIKKGRELKLKDYSKDIKSIKQRMLEIDPKSLDKDDTSKINIYQTAQNRFEINF